jgi:hypothetical protein
MNQIMGYVLILYASMVLGVIMLLFFWLLPEFSFMIVFIGGILGALIVYYISNKIED